MRNIVLIGFMGCGKTTIGKQMSRKCGLPLWDTDQMIEQRAGCTILELFATQGEEAFRTMETALLQGLCNEQATGIFSTGGGMPLRKENAKLLKQLGHVVWLRMTEDTAYQRLKQDKTRPILQCEDPRGKIRQLLQDRACHYVEAADIIVDVDAKQEEEIADEILRMIQEEHKL